MSDLAATLRSPTMSARVALYQLDASFIGGPILYFHPGKLGETGVSFGGVYYTPVDASFTGMEVTGNGALPMPRVKIANTNQAMQAIINTHGDLLGCTVSRIRTFEKSLDGKPGADPTAYLGPDRFRIERKLSENPIFIEFELSAEIDQQGRMIPGRQVLRDTCLFRYRIYNPDTGNFDYSKAQCPYTGSNYYTRMGVATTADQDVCSRDVSGCELRFGVGQPIPFGGFPGAARIRQ